MASDPISRRRVLAAAGAGLGGALAGCFNPPQAAEESPSPSPIESDTAAADPVGTEVYADVYESVIPSVALIENENAGQGSGFVFRDHLITNYHVVQESTSVHVRYRGHQWEQARVIASDVFADIAVMQPVSLPETAQSLPVRSTVPAVGTEVLAVGNPLELSDSVTRGIISGRNRSIPGPTGYSIPNAVQTDAIIHPGNSGGPLVDTEGQVGGGVVSGRAEGIGFAVSAPLVNRIVPALIEDGEYDHPHLGVVIRPVTPQLAAANDLPEIRGVYVTDLIEDGPSDGILRGTEPGLEEDDLPVGGDVIVELAGEPVATADDLSTILAFETAPGETVPVGIYRDGVYTEVSVRIGVRPAPDPQD